MHAGLYEHYGGCLHVIAACMSAHFDFSARTEVGFCWFISLFLERFDILTGQNPAGNWKHDKLWSENTKIPPLRSSRNMFVSMSHGGE